MSWSREAAEIVDVLRTLPGVDDVRAECLATSSDALHAAAAWFAPDERDLDEAYGEGYGQALDELAGVKLSKAARDAISAVLHVEWA